MLTIEQDDVYRKLIDMPTNDHIVQAYDDQFAELTSMISQMAGLAESQFEAAMTALGNRDDELAAATKEKDKIIDTLERDIEALAIKMIATWQPMANDLRYIVSGLKVSADIERLGDYSKNMAKRTSALNQADPIPMARSILRLGKLVQIMMRNVFDAFLQMDTQKAINVWESDEEVDNLYTSIFRELLTYMMEDPRHITPCTHLLFIAKNMERMGDLATNIAETVYYLVEGHALTEKRPKADSSAYTVLEPNEETNN